MVHLHGGRTPPEHDGYPIDFLLPVGRDVPLPFYAAESGDVTKGQRVYRYLLSNPRRRSGTTTTAWISLVPTSGRVSPGSTLSATTKKTLLASLRDFHHPVHVHLNPFQVLSRGLDGPGPYDIGWKDTIDLRPFENASIAVRFDGFRGRYVFHCHNLEHEDMAMMSNFVVT